MVPGSKSYSWPLAVVKGTGGSAGLEFLGKFRNSFIIPFDFHHDSLPSWGVVRARISYAGVAGYFPMGRFSPNTAFEEWKIKEPDGEVSSHRVHQGSSVSKGGLEIPGVWEFVGGVRWHVLRGKRVIAFSGPPLNAWA
ncbi:hypothetical protein Tco_0850735 [Tanacetum coccineum]